MKMCDNMKTEILTDSADGIARAGELLRSGSLVAIPTETVYGLAANALSSQAVSSIFAAKGRPQDNPLIVHISDISELAALVTDIPENALTLAEAFWPGPLTMIMKRSGIVAPEVSCGLDTVAVRMPSHKTAAAIIKSAGVPLSAPSANLSGKPSPTTARHVLDDMDGRIAAVLDGGECSVGVESTVISLCSETPRLLRPGAVTPEMIESCIGHIDIDPAVTDRLQNGAVAASPGMKYKHYAPKAEVWLVRGSLDSFAGLCRDEKSGGVMALCFDGEGGRLGVPFVEYGGANDPLSQCRGLFSALRTLDELGAVKVFARCPEQDGAGLAVYNRLARAAAFRIIDLR